MVRLDMAISCRHNVTPANAGVQDYRSGLRPWIPAFAGMTGITGF
jgi:hypothetical protein